MLTATFEEYAETLEQVEFKDKEAIRKYIEPSVNYDSVENSGIYIGYDDGDYVFANGTIMPDDYDSSTRSWYAEGLGYDTFQGIAPYEDLATNALCFSYLRRVDFYNGSKGVMAIDIYLSNLQETVNALKPMEKGRAIVIDSEHDFIISYFDDSVNGKSLTEANDGFLNNVINEDAILTKDGSGKDVYICASPVPGTTFHLVTAVYSADALAELNSFKFAAYLIMAIVVIVMIIAILISVKKIVSTPIQTLASDIEVMAKGDFTLELPKGKGDEIGLIQDELNIYIGKMRDLISNIQLSADKLQDQAHDSKNAAGNMSEATQQLIDRANAGKNDMKAVQKNMDNISASMNEMNIAVDNVGESAKKITSIIEIINSIAEQTNLLSLNASIEAARAGETGRGFAVVASEIATLASDSSNSTEKIAAIITEITEQITSLSDKSNANVEAITLSSEAVVTAEQTFEKLVSDLGEVGNSMQDMNQRMGSIDEISSSMAAISEEQSASSQEILNTTEDLSSSAQQVAADSQTVDSTTSTVSDSASEISESLSVFKI